MLLFSLTTRNTCGFFIYFFFCISKTDEQVRFDFDGNIVNSTKDVPQFLGLHHHGQEPEKAGYSLEELFLLSRSNYLQQRVLAINVLGNIIEKVGIVIVSKQSTISYWSCGDDDSDDDRDDGDVDDGNDNYDDGGDDGNDNYDGGDD